MKHLHKLFAVLLLTLAACQPAFAANQDKTIRDYSQVMSCNSGDSFLIQRNSTGPYFYINCSDLKASVLTGVSAAGLSGSYLDLTNKPTLLSQFTNDVPFVTATTAPVTSVNTVTGSVVLTTANINDSTDKRYITDAQRTVLAATSGSNTGDQTISDATISLTDITTNNATSSRHGFLPKLNGNVNTFLDGTGGFSSPAGAGTVTSVSVVTASGVSGTVANPTTTPALTISLGAITPTSVNASGNVAGANLSGSNSGDVTLSGEGYLSATGQAITVNAVNLSGSNATGTLAAARFPSLTGDISNSAGSLTTSLASIISPGSAGSATSVPVISWDAKGRVVAGSATNISIPASAINNATISSGASVSGSNTGDQVDSTLPFTDITTGNSSTSKHGFLPKLNGSATSYMDGTGAFSTPAGTNTGTVTSVSVVTGNGLSGSVANASTTPAITLSTPVTGIIKGAAGAFVAATSGTDYAPATSGTAILKGSGSGGFSSAVSSTDYAPATSGSSILAGNGSGGFSNITVGSGLSFSTGTLSSTSGGGSVTSASVVSANGFAGTVANASTTPAITLTATPNGILKSNGTAISAATSGTDYEVPITFSTGLTRSTNTVTVNTSQNIATLSNLTTNGFVKASGGTGALSIDTTTYLSAPVANASLATMAANTFKGNATGSSTTPTDLSVAQVKTALAYTTSDISGLSSSANMVWAPIGYHTRGVNGTGGTNTITCTGTCGTNTQTIYITPASTPIFGIKLVLPNFDLTASGEADRPTGEVWNGLAASLNFQQIGTPKNFTFYGALTNSILAPQSPDVHSFIVTDPLNYPMPANNFFAIRIAGSLAGTTSYSGADFQNPGAGSVSDTRIVTGAATPGGSGITGFSEFDNRVATGWTNQTGVNTNLTASGASYSLTPAIILGLMHKPVASLVAFGDSIDQGQNFYTADALFNYGFLDQGISNTIPFVNLSRGSMTATQFNTFGKAKGILSLILGQPMYVTDFLMGLGRNDLATGSTASQTQTAVAAASLPFQQQGMNVWVQTIPPRTASQDGWTSYANQFYESRSPTTTGAISMGDTTFTVSSATGITNGMLVGSQYGTCIAPGTTITISGTSVTMSNAATCGLPSGDTMYFGNNTPDSYASNVLTYNAALLAGYNNPTYNNDGYVYIGLIDIASIAGHISGSDYQWAVLSGSTACTGDGIHPNQACGTAIDAAGIVSPSRFGVH